MAVNLNETPSTGRGKNIPGFNIRTYTMIIALLSIWIIFTCATKGDFLTPRNLSNLFRQMSITGVLAIGMTFVIIAAQIDLSVGSLLGLTGGISAILNVWYNVNGIFSILIALVVGLLIGIWNGWWVAYKKVPSFIVTLAGMLVYRGILIGITRGTTIAPLSPEFKFLGQAYLTNITGYFLGALLILAIIYSSVKSRTQRIKYNLDVMPVPLEIGKTAGIIILLVAFIAILNLYQGIPFPIFILAVLAILFSYILNKTVFGRRVYAIGGNIEAAKLSGINVNKNTLMLFAMNGLLAATAGVLLTARLDAASVSAGQNAELDAIAACVIGGASMMGGIGTISGSIIGALVMASLDNGMSMLNIETFWQYIVKGLILLTAVWIDISSKNKS
ncbi:MAG: D-xylose transport system permease protein [Tepidanaerobacteraceae bacterium]|nr:D-xylose transport system permease protein [Tepidanaerobacteraceae bacterium]